MSILLDKKIIQHYNMEAEVGLIERSGFSKLFLVLIGFYGALTPVDRGPAYAMLRQAKQDRVEVISQRGGKQKMGSKDAQVYKVIDPPFWLKGGLIC